MSMICRTTGSPASRIHARAPARSMATGSGASRAMSSSCWAIRAPTSSRTAQNNASLPGKWWYSEPRLIPALAWTVSIDVPSYPCSANSRVATSTTCARVARPRSTFLFIRSPAFIGLPGASSAPNSIDRPTVGL